jgi:hypothetical protein
MLNASNIKKPKDILIELKSDIETIVKNLMIQKGVNKNSNIIDSIEFIDTENGISMLANDYYQYLSTGRKPKARKVPIEDLITWIKKYNIGSGNLNQIAFKIQRSIFLNGIKGKNYIDIINNSVADYSSEELAEILSNIIADQLVEAFKPLTKNN